MVKRRRKKSPVEKALDRVLSGRKPKGIKVKIIRIKQKKVAKKRLGDVLRARKKRTEERIALARMR